MTRDHTISFTKLDSKVAIKLVQDKLVKQGKKITINCSSLEEAEDIYIELVQKQAMRYVDGFDYSRY